MTRHALGALLAVAMVGGLACRRAEAPAPPAPVVVAAPSVAEPEDCAPCHADVVARFEKSGHRLAARRFDARTVDALFGANAPMREDARAAASLVTEPAHAQVASDSAGLVEARPITHVLGGRRREDFLSPRPDGLHVLPLSWSVTRRTWIDVVAEEQGRPIGAQGPLGWTSALRSHATACSRCHAAGAPAESPAGISCSTCHGGLGAHVASAGASKPARLADDAWKGCGPCHAVGADWPTTRDGASRNLIDCILPDALVSGGAFNPDFALDGRPLVPHGREAQSLARSRCFVEGGATCVTCHDPHGAMNHDRRPTRPGLEQHRNRTSLKSPDPDDSCRTCHADVAAPTGHAVPDVPAPFAEHEPEGPQGRLPGCVDCHMPALLAFSPTDRVRDHAIGVPDPGTASRTGAIDACSSCHPKERLADLSRRVAAGIHAPSGTASSRAGERRRKDADAFVAAAEITSGKWDERRNAQALDGVLDVLANASDPWTRAAAAPLVGQLGRGDARAATALADAWRRDEDPVLRSAVARAHAVAGGDPEILAGFLAESDDWRVRAAAAAALSERGDPRGASALEALRSDPSLPDAARAEATVSLAVAVLRSGADERGESLLLHAITLAPGNAAAWVNLGVVRARRGDDAGAREAWQRALELAPGNAQARANLARMDAAR